jgi:hypothetical protein
MGPKTDLDDIGKRKVFPLPGLTPTPRVSRSQPVPAPTRPPVSYGNYYTEILWLQACVICRMYTVKPRSIPGYIVFRFHR